MPDTLLSFVTPVLFILAIAAALVFCVCMEEVPARERALELAIEVHRREVNRMLAERDKAEYAAWARRLVG